VQKCPAIVRNRLQYNDRLTVTSHPVRLRDETASSRLAFLRIQVGGVPMAIKLPPFAGFVLLALIVGISARSSAEETVAPQSALGLGLAQYYLFVITDDDFLVPERNAWCHVGLTRAIDEVHKSRSQVELHLKSQFAGEPALLTDNKKVAGPRRAICFVCDADNRILAFCVGVPSGRQLVRLVEDADQVNLLLNVGSLQDSKLDDPEARQRDELAEAIRHRASRRVLQHYRPHLSKIDRQTSVDAAVTHLLPALNEDRAGRFHVSDGSDRLRWVSLQQHAETMRHWCDAILPAIAGKDVHTVWPGLAAVLWDAEPWTIAASDSDLIAWYGDTINSGPIVFSVVNDKTLLGQLEPQASNTVRSRESGADDAAALLGQISHRQIGLAALAQLMLHRKDPPEKSLRSAGGNTIWAVIENAQSPTKIVFGNSADRLAPIVRKIIRSR